MDSRRKLVFMARDPRSYGNNNHPNGRTGLYIVDVKDPWNPHILSYQWVPAGHTATCINDCRYIWSMGPANNGSHVNGQPQDIAGVLHPEWTGVPVFVTDVRDPLHPYTYAQPIDMKRNNNTTAYTHSADVDQHGLAWTSGFGGVRGYYTQGRHWDPMLGEERWATATDPIPYAGGSVASNDAVFATAILEHNSFHSDPGGERHVVDRRSRRPTAACSTRRISSTSPRRTRPATPRRAAAARPLHDREPRGQLQRRGLGSARCSAEQPVLHRDDRRLHGEDNPGATGGGCSAHWFTVLGDMVAIAFYGAGHADPRHVRSDQSDAGRLHPHPDRATGQSATNTSAVYWHNGYIYTADYSRGSGRR